MEPDLTTYSQRVDKIVKDLATDLRCGLSEQEAQSRLKTHGANRITNPDRISFLRLLLRPYQDFMILILAAAALVSFIIGDAQDAIAILPSYCSTASSASFRN